MHRAHEPSRLSPYQVIGQLARLRRNGSKASDISLSEAASWPPEDYHLRHALLCELAERIEEIGRPADHTWFGVGLDILLPMERDRLLAPLPNLVERLAALNAETSALASTLELVKPASFAGLDALEALAERVADAPDLTAEALASPFWDERLAEIDALLEVGTTWRSCVEGLRGAVSEKAWSMDAVALVEAFSALPDRFTLEDFALIERLKAKIPELFAEAKRLADALNADASLTLRSLDRVTRIAERVAEAPPANTEVFAAELWNDGVERAGDLAEAVACLQETRTQVRERLSEAAWLIDLSGARATLAAHGTGLLRFLSGDWRKANLLVRSVLTAPKLPLDGILPLLDALGRGQAALKEVREGEAFGVKAFGAHWRGERSSPEPLRALAEWMRSLGDLGAEPRMVASRKPDQEALRILAARVRAALSAVRLDLNELWAQLGDSAATVLGEADSPDQLDLARTHPRLDSLHTADEACGAMLTPVPAQLPERRRILTLLAQAKSAAEAIDARESLGLGAFDAAWDGRASDWPKLADASAWLQTNRDIRAVASRIPDRPLVARRAKQLIQDRDGLLIDLLALCEKLRLDRIAAFGSEDLASWPVEQTVTRVARWNADPEALAKWVGFRARAMEAQELGLGEFVARLECGALAPDGAVPLFEMSVFEAVLADLVQRDPEIGRFDGTLHSRLVSEFVELDLKRIAQARLEVVRTHHRRIPSPHGGAVGPLGILRAEIARRRGHMPIRQLIEKAAPAVQALKPVLMMSPLSIAQYLPPGALNFDLLVMDEASQIQPIDALGAVARCGRVVIVGDPQQLPPTAFFSKMTGSTDEEYEDDGAKVADIESILGLFSARGLPKRMLRWHYRSRHQSLIAVSNSQFYENKLFIVPSPHTHEAGMGLRFHHVANGLFDTGKTRTNVIEAKVVAQAIVDHAANSPGLSLGVAAFSSQQRRAIQEQLEILRRTLPPEHEGFFQQHTNEPFFIKNLENVQGDERDVIFISVGYAASTPGGKPAMRFGPLGAAGGDRRLNVLISRAKRRCEVFSSITDEDIDPDFAASRKGVFAFRLFLHYARTGRLALQETTGRDHDGVLEEQVAAALQERGYQVHRNVGIAGLFVDLAVTDPDQGGRYILGIDCDGDSYRTGRSARDRDRIRRAVLEDHGWTMHRLWSGDWFQRPGEELARIISALDGAKLNLGSQEAASEQPRAVPVEIVAIERESITEIGLVGVAEASAVFVEPYQEATLKRPPSTPEEIHLTPIGALTHLAEQVVAREGPVHLDEVTARIRDAWGAGRAGGRIRATVERAVAISVTQGRIVQEDGFLWEPGCTPVLRDRSHVSSPTLRKPEMLPPSELRSGILRVIRANFGATPDQVAQTVSRDLGFKAVSAQLRAVIDSVVEDAIRRSELIRQDAILVLGPAADHPAKPPLATEALLAFINEGESERLEFKQTLRFDVATLALNRKLEDVVIKTIAGFANQSGGTLLIGVCDNGDVTGIEPDYETLASGNRDKFELHLTHLLNMHFGPAFRATGIRVSFPAIGNKTICRVDVQRSPSGIVVKLPDRNGSAVEHFYVRMGNSTHELSPSQITAFIANRGR
jgi:very-short-patch-repair endonuclease